jgi:hypothetical protein
MSQGAGSDMRKWFSSTEDDMNIICNIIQGNVQNVKRSWDSSIGIDSVPKRGRRFSVLHCVQARPIFIVILESLSSTV